MVIASFKCFGSFLQRNACMKLVNCTIISMQITTMLSKPLLQYKTFLEFSKSNLIATAGIRFLHNTMMNKEETVKLTKMIKYGRIFIFKTSDFVDLTLDVTALTSLTVFKHVMLTLMLYKYENKHVFPIQTAGEGFDKYNKGNIMKIKIEVLIWTIDIENSDNLTTGVSRFFMNMRAVTELKMAPVMHIVIRITPERSLMFIYVGFSGSIQFVLCLLDIKYPWHF